MNKLFDLFNLFRKGAEVSNKEVWKDGGNAATLLVPILMLLVKLAGDFGYTIQLSTEDAALIAAGIVAFVQFIVHNVTSKHAGVLPAKPADSTSNSVSTEGVPAKAEAPVQPVTVSEDKTKLGTAKGEPERYGPDNTYFG